MITLGNIPVLTTVSQIMVTLQRELKLNGSHLLKDVVLPRGEGQDVQFTCPYHKNGLENKPSCGITTREQKRGEVVIPVGTFNCFSCKSHGHITELISHCFGKQDGGVFGKAWILEHFNNYEIENRSNFFQKITRQKEKNELQYVTENELQNYRFTHPYMYKRGLTDEIIDLFDIGYDSSFILKDNLSPIKCITFPVRDEFGNVVFIARRSIKGKIYHYPKEVDKPIYGLYESKQLFPKSKELYICESMFNCLTLVRLGKPSVALLGTGTHTQLDKLRDLDYRKYIICTDSDEAGERGRKKLYDKLSKYKLIEHLRTPAGTDINDFSYCKTYDELLNEIEKKEVM